jgi:N-acetyl-alpha-D-muramate 1-phosphate uridylyltransferase
MTHSNNTSPPRRAMILAAGLGTRMRPLTNDKPKPLVAVGGKPLINHVLDRLAATGVETAVINVHHFADLIEQHLKPRRVPKIIISDERDVLLGTGGGVTKALPLLGEAPFFLANSDTIWIDGVKPNLERLAAAFDPTQMDALLLLAPTISSVGYSGRGDYAMTADGQLRPRPEREIVPFVYTGVAVLRPELFSSAPADDFPLTLLFNRAADAGRLYGIRLEGVWMHVGTPESIAAAEAAILASAA